MEKKLIFMANMNEDTKGMGTTVAIAVVIEDDVYICHVGDSRIYLYDSHSLKQITKILIILQ